MPAPSVVAVRAVLALAPELGLWLPTALLIGALPAALVVWLALLARCRVLVGGLAAIDLGGRGSLRGVGGARYGDN